MSQVPFNKICSVLRQVWRERCKIPFLTLLLLHLLLSGFEFGFEDVNACDGRLFSIRGLLEGGGVGLPLMIPAVVAIAREERRLEDIWWYGGDGGGFGLLHPCFGDRNMTGSK